MGRRETRAAGCPALHTPPPPFSGERPPRSLWGVCVAGQVPQDGGPFLGGSLKPPRGETPLAWGLVCSLGGSRGLGLAGLQLRGAQGGGNQRQPCGPRFHLPASKRRKQTLSLCQAAAPSSRPQPSSPLLPPAPSPKVSSASSRLGAPQRGPDSRPRREELGPARPRAGRG